MGWIAWCAWQGAAHCVLCEQMQAPEQALWGRAALLFLLQYAHAASLSSPHSRSLFDHSIWSLAALAYAAAFTLPAAYARNRETVQRTYASATATVAQRWDALGLSRKHKAGPACGGWVVVAAARG